MVVVLSLLAAAVVVLVGGTLYGRSAVRRRRDEGARPSLTAMETVLTGGVGGVLAMLAGGWALTQRSARDELAGVLLLLGGAVFVALTVLALRVFRNRA